MRAVPRNALVLGGSSGIGEAIARQLSEDGHAIHLTYRRHRDAAEKVMGDIRRQQGSAAIHALDADDPAQLAQLLAQEFDPHERPLGIVVNCIGVSEITALLAGDAAAKWERSVRINMTFMFAAANMTLPLLINNGWGRWINIASVSAFETRPGVGCYSVTKAAQNSLTRFLAQEAGPHVTVNSVCPGMTRTEHLLDSNRRYAALHGLTLEQVNADILSATYTKRFVEPFEIAAAVSFLCSGPAASITGQTLTIAGGRG